LIALILLTKIQNLTRF